MASVPRVTQLVGECLQSQAEELRASVLASASCYPMGVLHLNEMVTL